MRFAPGTFLKLNRNGEKLIRIEAYHSGGLTPWYSWHYVGTDDYDMTPVAANDTEELETNAKPLSSDERRLVALLYE
jgi:hypothetical protein